MLFTYTGLLHKTTNQPNPKFSYIYDVFIYSFKNFVGCLNYPL